MNKTRCKFRCVSSEPQFEGSEGRKVVLETQYDQSLPEDQSFTRATPWGRMEVLIDNPAALAAMAFEPGKCYYVDLTPAG